MSKDLDISWGDGLFKRRREYPWLVREVLAARDILLMIGKEKVGKSILMLQLAFAIISGEKFLGRYDVLKPLNVLFLQTEGKRDETVDRIESMAKAIPFVKTKFAFIYRKNFFLDHPENLEALDAAIAKLPFKPDVLFIDSLYQAMSGDLNENLDARRFIHAVDTVLDKYDMTCVILHHESKIVYSDTYGAIDKGDQASFGAACFNWWIESIFRLRRDKKNVRILTCNTQRSGKMLEKESLLLVGNPLHFELRDDFSDAALKTLNVIRIKPGVTREELASALTLAPSTVAKALGELLGAKRIFEKEGGYVVYGDKEDPSE